MVMMYLTIDCMVSHANKASLEVCHCYRPENEAARVLTFASCCWHDEPRNELVGVPGHGLP